MDKKIALVLGGTAPHIELVQNLHRRGYFVSLIDYLDNPPAAEYADEHIKESTLDYDRVLSVARDKGADLVISTCIDQANVTACYVAEKLGLPHPYSFETALDVTDKSRMKKIMALAGIPTAKYIVTDSLDVTAKIEFPMVVKPVDCNGSKGVRKANNETELRTYLAEALKLSRTKHAIVEEFKDGSEIQVDCYIQNGQARVLMTRQKQKPRDNFEKVLQSFGSTVPAPLGETGLCEAQRIAQKIASAFKLDNTPMFYQAIVKNDDISVIEFAPRVGGGLSYKMLRDIAKVDIVDATVNSFLGIEQRVEPGEQKGFVASNIIYMHTGIFSHVEGIDALMDEGVIYSYSPMKQKGDKIDGDMSSRNRVGAFMVKADTLELLREKQQKAFDYIKIFDIYGNDLTQRENFLN